MGSEISRGLFLSRYNCRRRCEVSVLHMPSFVFSGWSCTSERWVQWSVWWYICCVYPNQTAQGVYESCVQTNRCYTVQVRGKGILFGRW